MNSWSKQFVRVAPPTVYAGVGNALRQAFASDCDILCVHSFDDLLAQLDRAPDASGRGS